MKINTSASAYDIARRFDTIVESARSAVESKGLRIPDSSDTDRPFMSDGTLYDGCLPSNLEMLPNGDLVELMSVHAAWVSYVNAVLGDAQAELDVIKAKEKAVRSAVLKEVGKEEVDCDKRYIDVAAELAYHNAYLGYVEAIKSSASSGYKTLSRVITVRGQDVEMQGRYGNAQRGSYDRG